MKNKPVVLIKIGGSLITDKAKPFTLRKRALDVIASEVKRARKETGKLLVLGHGGGSFPHVPAKKYSTHLGIINKKSYRGIAEVQDAAARLNRIVIDKLLEKKLPAVSINPSSCYLMEDDKLKTAFFEPIKKLLEFEMIPVLYGDVVLDTKTGCIIMSTERTLGYLGRYLLKQGFKVEKIIHCGQTNGVYDENGETIKIINSKNFKHYKKVLDGSGGIDVTGGMIHKVEEALKLAKKGIPGLIIDGIEHGTLSRAVKGGSVLGTKVER